MLLSLQYSSGGLRGYIGRYKYIFALRDTVHRNSKGYHIMSRRMLAAVVDNMSIFYDNADAAAAAKNATLLS